MRSTLRARRVPRRAEPRGAREVLAMPDAGDRADAAEALASRPLAARRRLPLLLREERHDLVLVCLLEVAAMPAVARAASAELKARTRRLAAASRSPIVRAFAIGAAIAQGATLAWLRRRLTQERSAMPRVALLEGLGDRAALVKLARSGRSAVAARAEAAIRRIDVLPSRDARP